MILAIDEGTTGVTCLVIDRDGREIGRLMGAAEWDSPETVEFLKARVEQGKTVPAPEPAL